MDEVLKNKLDNLIENKSYSELSKYSFNISVSDLMENELYISWILKANLEAKNYDLGAFFIENLIRNGYESYELYLYLFTSLMKINDFYRIKSYLVRSKLLNDNIVGPIFDGELTVFSEINKIEDDNMFSLSLIIMVLNDIFDNYDITSLTKEDIVIAYFEMLDLAYSNGIDQDRLETNNFIGNLLND